MEPSDSKSSDNAIRRTILQLVPFTLAVLALCSLRYLQILIGTVAFASPVHIRYLEPTVWFFKDSLGAGRMPLWNPYCYLGMPQLPDCFPGNFYPLNVLLLLPEYNLACVAFLVVHQIIGALGAYLVVCKVGRKDSVLPMVLAAVYLLATIVLCGDDNLALVAGFAWLPYCLFGLLKCLSCREVVKPHPAGLVVTNSVFLGLLYLAGSLVLALAATLVFVIAILINLLIRNKSILHGLLYVLSTIVAVGIAAPVLFPFLEWARYEPNSRTFETLVGSSAQYSIGKRGIGSLITSLWSGPLTAQAQRSSAELSAKLGRHEGRYLALLPSGDVSGFNPDLPNRNMMQRQVNALGYRGHPVQSYRALAESVLETDCTNGFIPPPEDTEMKERVSKFLRLTSSWTVEPGVPVFARKPDLPPAYAIDAWRWSQGRQEILDQVSSVDKPFDPQTVLLVERTQHLEIDEEKLDKMPLSRVSPPVGPPGTDSEPGQATVTPVDVLSHEPEHVSISLNAERPSFVVVMDSFYPGWKAYVDGVPAPMYRANGIGRAVFVSAGSHLVGMDYRPDSIRHGISIAIGALILELVLTFFWLLKLIGKTVRWMSYGKFE